MALAKNMITLDDSDEELYANNIPQEDGGGKGAITGSTTKRQVLASLTKSASGDSKSATKRRLPASIKIAGCNSTAEEIASQSQEKPLSLSEAQYKVLQRLMSRQNTFFTGAAGTGKSYCVNVLESIIRHLGKTNVVAKTAPTGVAACNINGMTIHSWAGVGLGTDSVEKLAHKIERHGQDATRQRWKNTEILVIDEISMLGGDLFTKISDLGKKIRKDSRPFGGIQVILCGDFFQLPPVASGGNRSPFCFETPTWNEVLGPEGSIVLDKVFRQKDGPFVRILNSMRRGIITKECHEVLNQKVIETRIAKSNAANAKAANATSLIGSPFAPGSIKPTVLFSRNADCDRYNENELEKLPMMNVTEADVPIDSDEGEVFEFKASDTGKKQDMLKGLKAPVNLELRVGAQVMLLKNLDQEVGLVNGSRGVIKRFADLDGQAKPMPIVEFYINRGGTETTLQQHLGPVAFEITLGAEIQATRHQIPLMLAWAVSIHKAQGCTIPYLEISFDGMFEYGQAYVALSRATDLPGLSLRNFNPNTVKVHQSVARFYESLGCDLAQSEEISNKLITTTVTELADTFVLKIPGAKSKARDPDEWFSGNSSTSNTKNTTVTKKGLKGSGDISYAGGKLIAIPKGNVFAMFASGAGAKSSSSTKASAVEDEKRNKKARAETAAQAMVDVMLRNSADITEKSQPCDEYLLGKCLSGSNCQYIHDDAELLASYHNAIRAAGGTVANNANENDNGNGRGNVFSGFHPPSVSTFTAPTPAAAAVPVSSQQPSKLSDEQRATMQRNKDAALAKRRKLQHEKAQLSAMQFFPI